MTRMCRFCGTRFNVFRGGGIIPPARLRATIPHGSHPLEGVAVCGKCLKRRVRPL